MGEQPKPIGRLASDASMPRLLKRLANEALSAVVVLVQHAFEVVEPDDPQGAGVATARIARDAAMKSLENMLRLVVELCLRSFVRLRGLSSDFEGLYRFYPAFIVPFFTRRKFHRLLRSVACP